MSLLPRAISVIVFVLVVQCAMECATWAQDVVVPNVVVPNVVAPNFPGESTQGTDADVAAVTFVQPKDRVDPNRNFNRQTIFEHWRSQLAQNQAPTYPALKLDRKPKVGDLGLGDSSIVLTLVQRLSKKDQLLELRRPNALGGQSSTLFQFRGFDFANKPVGSQVIVSRLCEVTGVRKFKNKQQRIQTALIVQKLDPKQLALPIGKSLDELDALESASRKRPTESLESRPVQQPVKEPPSSMLGKKLDRDDDEPKFEVRKWLTKKGDRSISGKLVGVGGEAVWIRIATGKVIRVQLSALHPIDREHALKKKQAILDYRKLKK